MLPTAPGSPLNPNDSPRTDLVLNDDNQTLQIIDYYSAYVLCFEKSAAYLVNAGYAVVHAKRNLSRANFKKFRDAVKLESNSTAFRQIVAIGNNVPRLKPVLRHLPSRLETLYRLTRMDADEFDYVLKCGVLSPFMTDKELDEALKANQAAKKPTKHARDNGNP